MIIPVSLDSLLRDRARIHARWVCFLGINAAEAPQHSPQCGMTVQSLDLIEAFAIPESQKSGRNFVLRASHGTSAILR